MIWLNGAICLPDDARIDPTDRGVTLGDGLFETIAVRDGSPRRLDRHLERLRRGASLLGIPVPLDDDGIVAACAALIRAEGGRAGALRLTLTRGPAPRGLLPPADPRPTLVIVPAPPVPPSGPARLIIAASTRRNEQSPLSRIKSLNCLDNVLARREAAARGCDDAVLLDTAGRVAETTIANLFAVIDGALVTPPIADGALPGIARGEILARCGAVERSLEPETLMRADEVFLSNSLSLRPVVAIGGTQIGGGTNFRAFESVRRRLEQPCSD